MDSAFREGPTSDLTSTPVAGDRAWPSMVYWAKVTVVVVLTIAGAIAVRSVLNILFLIVVAVVVAVGAEPIVAWLVERGLARGWSVVVLLLALTLLAAAFAFLVVPPLVSQASGLGSDIPRYLSSLEARPDGLGDLLRQNHVADQARSFIEHLPQTAGRSFGTILGVAGRVGGIVFGAVTVAVLAIYFMLTLPRMRRTATILVRPHHRERARRVIDSTIERIGGYVIGNTITSMICGLATLVAMLAMGIPFAVPLAVWAGLADLIPAVGSYLGAAPAIVVAFVDSPARGLLTGVFFIGYQQFENYVVVPRVMKNAVDLSPAAVITATLVGGSLAGLAGALLALPVAATLKVIIVEVWLRGRAVEGDRLAKEQVEEAGIEPLNEGARV